jgi:hypothetical protein
MVPLTMLVPRPPRPLASVLGMRPCEGWLSHAPGCYGVTRISTRSGLQLKANRIVSTKVELQVPLAPMTQFKPGVKSIL